jgi:hypothetical protein
VKTFLALLVAVSFALPAVASACGGYGRMNPYDRDVDNLAWQVGSSAGSGQLTAYERRRADRQVQHVRQLQATVNYDGKVTAREQRRMRRAINRAERLIQRYNNNAMRPAASVAAND